MGNEGIEGIWKDEDQTTPNVELFSSAWEIFKERWEIAIGFSIIATLLGAIIGAVYLQVILGGAIAVGVSLFWLKLSRKDNPEIANLFEGFNSFLSAWGAYLLMTLIVFGGFLLLVIPGIYWACTYAMTFYIIADNPNCGGNEALVKSREMMYGHKMKFFRFYLRCMALMILGAIPCGLGWFVVIPWMSIAMAKFYDDIRVNPIKTH